MAIDFNPDVTNVYSNASAVNNVPKVDTDKKVADKASETKVSEKDAAAAGAVFEKSDEKKAATYSINKMSEEDRANLISQMKADQESRVKQLTDMVAKMMSDQGKAYGIATGDDSVWKLFADGKVTVTEAAKKQAQEDISEDGYWGVKQTSQRLFDFASALAGDDVEKMKKWYDGYSFANVGSVYNPNSVMQAIDNEDFDSYWTETSAAENLMDYITKDFSGLSKTIAELIAGIDVPVDTNGFANDLTTFRNSDDVLTLMIHLGYVAYDSEKKTVHIPNEEIRRVFNKKRFNVSCPCD